MRYLGNKETIVSKIYNIFKDKKIINKNKPVFFDFFINNFLLVSLIFLHKNSMLYFFQLNILKTYKK